MVETTSKERKEKPKKAKPKIRAPVTRKVTENTNRIFVPSTVLIVHIVPAIAGQLKTVQLEATVPAVVNLRRLHVAFQTKPSARK